MSIQTASLADLEKASNVLIGEARFTAEYNAPCIHLVERHQLGHGENTYRFLKFGQASMGSLTDGQDMTDSQDFNMTYVDASPTEVGAKFIVTDKARREIKPESMRIAGRMLGDGMGRKRDEDIIALFVNLDNAFGATAKYLGNANASGCVANVRGLKFPNPIYVVHHPNAIGYLGQAGSTLGAVWAGMPDAYATAILKNFFKITINGIAFFEDGNIDAIAGDTTGYGAIFSKNAMGVVESKAPYTEMERDASLRATEIVMVSDYIAVEIDGTYGASMRYYVSAISTIV